MGFKAATEETFTQLFAAGGAQAGSFAAQMGINLALFKDYTKTSFGGALVWNPLMSNFFESAYKRYSGGGPADPDFYFAPDGTAVKTGPGVTYAVPARDLFGKTNFLLSPNGVRGRIVSNKVENLFSPIVMQTGSKFDQKIDVPRATPTPKPTPPTSPNP